MIAVMAITVAASLAGQSTMRLPIAEGIWVEAGKQCGTADSAFFYGKNRFGSIAHYRSGPSQSVERIGRIEPGARGFVRIFTAHQGNPAQGQMAHYEMPSAFEVAPRPNGQAIIRASSYATGEVAWSSTFRQCAPETLSANLRALTKR